MSILRSLGRLVFSLIPTIVVFAAYVSGGVVAESVQPAPSSYGEAMREYLKTRVHVDESDTSTSPPDRIPHTKTCANRFGWHTLCYTDPRGWV